MFLSLADLWRRRNHPDPYSLATTVTSNTSRRVTVACAARSLDSLTDSWQAHPDTPGEFGLLVRILRRYVDVAASLELRDGQAPVQAAPLVDVLRRIAPEEHLPGVGNVAGVHRRVGEDHRGAIGGQGVVEAGVLSQLLDIAHVVEKDSPTVLDRTHRPEEVDRLRRRLPVVRPHPDDVALVGHHVHQLILPEEAGQRRERLRARFACLDGDG